MNAPRTLGVGFGLCVAFCAQAVPIVTSGSAINAAGLQATVDAFRASLGALNPNVAGSFGSGRREINWDGVPDAFAAPNNLPANFFNANSPRGAVFATPGSGFQVSANASNPTSTPIEFGNLDATLPGQFGVFSPQRLFTAIGSTITDISFFIPGSGVAATVSAFGSVFTDVDAVNTTSLELFSPSNVSLGVFFAPTSAGNEGLSFVGVRFTSEQIGRVRITSGNVALGGGAGDAVAMDDFIYAEPIPEPQTQALMLSGLGVLALLARRRRVGGR